MKKYLTSYILHLTSYKGFTLIELLVVVVIISILAALLMVNFVGVRQRGRDATRKSNIKTMQTALELYRADNGAYPTSSTYFNGCGSPAQGPGPITYIQKIPCDPLNTTTPYSYAPDVTGSTYTLIACLENANDSDKATDGLNGCASPFTASYKQLNP